MFVAGWEQVLLAQVREQETETIVMDDGFSCSEQIGQTTDRRVHLAQVLDMAVFDGPKALPREEPFECCIQRLGRVQSPSSRWDWHSASACSVEPLSRGGYAKSWRHDEIKIALRGRRKDVRCHL
jgi:hypothetical protein